MVETRIGDHAIATSRSLDEHDVFVRDNRTLLIVNKVRAVVSKPLSDRVSARNPFSIDPQHERDQVGELYLFASGKDGRVDRRYVGRGQALIDEWKVLVSKTSSEHAGQTDKQGRRRVLSRLEVMPPGTVATGSYLVLGPFVSENQARNAVEYLQTRFVRFLISAVLMTQNTTRASYAFVPDLGFDRPWADAELYGWFGLTEEEIALIESQIKPMAIESGADDA